MKKSGEIQWEEGCLSVPDYYENIIRANDIKVQALNQHGKTFELEASEMLSVCIQHEIDHLDGILFVDHLSKLKQKTSQEKNRKESDKTLRFNEHRKPLPQLESLTCSNGRNQ